MPITLCLDFGNTRLKCAIFNEDAFIASTVLPEEPLPTLTNIIQQYQPTHSILSSVIAQHIAINDLLATHTQLHILNHHSKLPFTCPVGKPETIGADRLALCAAAVTIYPKNHVLVIALGSCITYNYINIFHEFLGGSISPGLSMRFKSMNEHTHLLPLVQPQSNFPLIGYDTKTNLLSGAVLGMAKEIDGIISLYQERFAELKVLLTGGDCPILLPHLSKPIVYDEHLLFKGLLAINNLNHTSSNE